MKHVVGFLAVFLILAAAAPAKEYTSSFGFTFSAPDAWLIMTKQELVSNPVFTDADPGVKAKVESGSVEILYDTTTSDATFTDYVDVKLGPRGAVPDGPDDVTAGCAKYAQKLAKAAGRTLAVAKCEVRDVGALKMFYVEYQGIVAETVTMQYQLARPDGRLVYLTATCKQSSLDKFRPDFEAIVKSIKFS